MVQCGISYPLQLWPGLYWGDQTETGDKTEETPEHLQEGDDGEAVAGHVWENHHPINWEDIQCWRWYFSNVTFGVFT